MLLKTVKTILVLKKPDILCLYVCMFVYFLCVTIVYYYERKNNFKNFSLRKSLSKEF
jgi:hypothetical protein